MGIGIKGNANAAMSQSLTHYLWVNTLLEQKAGVGVAKVVEPGMRYTSSFCHPLEGMGYSRGV
jgi:hypothetical protein